MPGTRSRSTRSRRLAAAIVALGAVAALALVAPPFSPAGAAPGTGTGTSGQTITVSDVDDLDPTGTTVTVTGTGFDAAAGFNTVTEGLYVGFCVDNGVGQTPTPCVGGVDMTGSGGASKWVTNNPLPGAPAVSITSAGSFTTEITISSSDDFVDCLALAAGKACKVFTRMDHRAGGDRTQDVRVPVTFAADPDPVAPSIEITPATDADPTGQDIVVEGHDFPTGGPGVQVVFGPAATGDLDDFSHSVTVPASAIADDGSFTTTLTGVAAAYTDGDGDARDFSDGGAVVSTFRAQSQPDPDGRWVSSAPLHFAGGTRPASTTTLVAAPTSVTTGTEVRLTATVATAASGTVEYRVGSTVLGAAGVTDDGTAVLVTTFPTAGPRAITAHFSGTALAEPSVSAPVTVTVRNRPTPPPTGPPLPPPDDPDTDPSGSRTGTGPQGQTLTATPVDNLDPDGTAVSVTGKGFAISGFDLDTEGMYLAFCVDNGAGAAPSPCVGGVDTSGTAGTSKWVTNAPYDGVPASAVSAIGSDGSFSATITVEARDEYVDCLALPAGKRCVITTRADHRSSADRSQDVKIPVCFAGEAACATDPINPGGDGGPGDAPFAGFPVRSPGSSYGGSGTSRVGPLAATGTSSPQLVPYALALVAGGAALVALARRRRRALALVPAVAPTAAASRRITR